MSRNGSHASIGHVARGGQGSPGARLLVTTLATVVLVIALVVLSQPPVLAQAPASEAPLDEALAVVVIDDEGTEVTIPAEAQRIISLTPGTTEILFALGVGDRVVATTDADDYPREAVPLPDVASFGAIDIEKVIDFEPDLIIAGGNGYTPTDGIERLRSLGYAVLVIYAPSVGGVISDVELIGRAVGRDDAADDLATTMRTEIEALSALVGERPHPRVFYEIDASVAIYGPADESFLAEMVELAGGVPITSGSALSFEVSLERLIAEDPEVIVLGDAAYGTTPEAVAARPGWGAMSAVRDGALRPVEDVLVTRPGPRLAEGLRDLIEAIHPDALR